MMEDTKLSQLTAKEFFEIWQQEHPPDGNVVIIGWFWEFAEAYAVAYANHMHGPGAGQNLQHLHQEHLALLRRAAELLVWEPNPLNRPVVGGGKTQWAIKRDEWLEGCRGGGEVNTPGNPNPQALWMDESPDHFLWRRKAEELQKDAEAYRDDCDKMARERNHYEKLVDRAAELLRTVWMNGIQGYEWDKARQEWLRDAGMEEK